MKATKPNVLIVGAGAVGLVMGYHLHLAGAAVTYLVRSGRRSAFAPPQRLYDYDTGAVNSYAGYDVVDDFAGLAARQFDFVVVTLDGDTSRTPQGRATLTALGDAIRKTEAVVILVAIGVGIREHYLKHLRIDSSRVLRVLFQIQTHQIEDGAPLFAPADTSSVETATVGFKQPGNRVGLRVTTDNPKAAKRFAALYDECATSSCGLVNPALVGVLADSVFPTYAAWDLAGWPPIDTVAGNHDLWRTACRAQKEILRLPRNRWQGKVAALLMGSRVTAHLHRGMEKDLAPFDLPAFNRYHHGAKVRAQNVGGLKICLEEGRRHGHPMTALSELLTRLGEAESGSVAAQ